MTLRPIPVDIILQLTNFLNEDDSIALMSSCKEWYHTLIQASVRKLKLHVKNHTCERWLEKIQRLVREPFDQLDVWVEDLQDTSLLLSILNEARYHLHQLRCSDRQFFEVMGSVESLAVKKLIIYPEKKRYPIRDIARVDKSFSKVHNCEILDFSSENDPTILPLVSFVKDLTLTTVILRSRTHELSNYGETLYHLSLYDCHISDVSMLGSIPFLELKRCKALVDISSLKNNDRIVIESCNKIEDYSCSFINTRRIEIMFSKFGANCFIDLMKWSKVEDLQLIDCDPCTRLHYQNCKELPRSIRKCHLGGSCVNNIDFIVTSDRNLEQLILSHNNTITYLEGYGLERVPVIKITYMSELRSLEGLGLGRNRKIIISDCHKITDFSPLNHVPIVEIKYCNGFTDPLQVRCVRDLTIIPIKEISFTVKRSGNSLSEYLRSFARSLNIFQRLEEACPHSYESIQCLTILNTILMQSFDGLEKIPKLQVDFDSFHLIKRFLSEGKHLANQTIILLPTYRMMTVDEALTTHNQYLSDTYSYENKLPKKWVWIRKTE